MAQPATMRLNLHNMPYAVEWARTLERAVAAKDLERLRLLLSAVSFAEDPLRFAVATRLPGIINMVYKGVKMLGPVSSADIAQRLARARCPLPYAVDLGDLEVVELMLAAGTNPNERVHSDEAAIHCAAARGCAELIGLLLRYGADVDARMVTGDTPLRVMLDLADDCLEVARLLLDAGADPNAADGNGDTPMHVALSQREVDVVRFIVARGGDLYSKNRMQQTALHLATINDDLEVVKYVLASDIDVDAVDVEGNTALHQAARYFREEVVQQIVEHGADCDVINRMGRTALGGAALTPRGTKYAGTIIVQHLAALEASGRPISPENMEAIESQKVLATFYQICRSEMKRMQRLFYGDVSFLDIFAGTERRVSQYARNKELVKVFDESVELGYLFYGPTLKERFDEHVYKQERVARTVELLQDTLLFDREIIDIIVTFLSEEEMQRIVDTSEED